MTSRRSFLKGVFAGAALAALPTLSPSPAGTTVIPASVMPCWTMMLYGTPILFFPKKSVRFLVLETTIETRELSV